MLCKDKIKLIQGKDKGEIFVFALNACGWCSKTKGLLKELGVKHSFVDVDLLDSKDKDEAQKEIMKKVDRLTSPLIIINQTLIRGFDEDEIKNALNKNK